MQKSSAGSKPWLAWRMLVVCAMIFITTYWTDGTDTVLRWSIVVLYFVTAWTCLLKERVLYGWGDRIAVYETWLILALTVLADLLDVHPYSFLSVFSLLTAVVMLRQTTSDTRKRLMAIEPF